MKFVQPAAVSPFHSPAQMSLGGTRPGRGASETGGTGVFAARRPRGVELLEGPRGPTAFDVSSSCFRSTKTFSSNGPVADLSVLYAVTDPDKGTGGITAFLIELDTPGFSAGQRFEKMGLRACSIGELVLEDVRVGAEAVLGGVGGGATVFFQSMEWERTCLVASHVGTMQRLLRQALDHARNREAFDLSPDDMPVFGCMASKFADIGVTGLYQEMFNQSIPG